MLAYKSGRYTATCLKYAWALSHCHQANAAHLRHAAALLTSLAHRVIGWIVVDEWVRDSFGSKSYGAKLRQWGETEAARSSRNPAGASSSFRGRMA